MVKTVEFITYHNQLSNDDVNDWLKEKGDKVEIVDIKYSIGCFQESNDPRGHSAELVSGVLIIYKTK
jgi:hypothetical protein